MKERIYEAVEPYLLLLKFNRNKTYYCYFVNIFLNIFIIFNILIEIVISKGYNEYN